MSSGANNNGRYILAGEHPVPCDDVTEWTHWMMHNDRHVARTEIQDAKVSTVFLGFCDPYQDPPMLFETYVFGGPNDGESSRCTTWEEAKVMHKDMCHALFTAGSKPMSERAKLRSLLKAHVKTLREQR